MVNQPSLAWLESEDLEGCWDLELGSLGQLGPKDREGLRANPPVSILLAVDPLNLLFDLGRGLKERSAETDEAHAKTADCCGSVLERSFLGQDDEVGGLFWSCGLFGCFHVFFLVG